MKMWYPHCSEQEVRNTIEDTVVKEMFLADANKDGYLTMDEVINHSKKTNPKHNEKEVRTMFKAMDI